MRVLVAGSSSVLGRHLIAALKARGHTVRALTRSEARVHGAGADEVAVGDALAPGTLERAMVGVDAVISSVGASVLPAPSKGWRGFHAIDWPANKNLIDAAVVAGVKKLVYVSVFGAEKTRHLAYCDAHERVVDYARDKGLDASIVRPTAFHSALTEFVVLARRGIVPVFGAAFQTNPIADADLAAVCVDALSPGPRGIDAGGPEVLSRRQIAEIAIAASGRRAKLLSLPPCLLRVAAMFAFAFPRGAQLFSFFAHVMSRDLVAPRHGSGSLARSLEEKRS